ncbi:unnamed protein product [Sphenostylis stenocarpa]|uniref:S-protein homolog n=1 Tax=Sphenostylis stenocarpa TaxID=92480 RepID=A0AA86SW35_9FABA|nr:unnamed protein product [Sphenostylis stenocarpa]
MEKKKNKNSGMLGKSAYLLSLVLALASPTLLNGSGIFPGFIKWHVYVMNELSNNQSLLVYCQSKDDDLGSHEVCEGGNLTWSFRTDFLHSTVFWCSVKRNNSDGCDSVASFDVFWYDEHLFEKCNWKNCVWRVRDGGIYLTTFCETHADLYYHWGDIGHG